MRTCLLHDTQFRTKITQQLQQTVGCLIQTQSSDFIQRLHARMAMKGLWVDAPLVSNVLVTIHDLYAQFFHVDGTICQGALHGNTQANDSIIGLIDWIDRQVGVIIARDQYISLQAYEQLRVNCSSNIFSYLYRWFTAATGKYCPLTNKMHNQAQEYNGALARCLKLCERYEFRAAEQLRDKYQAKTFNDIIRYYKAIQIQEEQQKLAALYDKHGIIHIASNDPLYQHYKQELARTSPEQKKIINQNFLVRYHLKNAMHEKWAIPQSAPVYVHDALYTIMGTDCSSLSDIFLLQERIEQIISVAPENQRKQLVQALYLPNGIIKEYAQHDSSVPTINMPASILGTSATDIRQQLNTFIGLRIKNPQESAKINNAIKCLQKSLGAKTEPERIKFKEQLNSLYFQLHEQPQQQKSVATSQDNNTPTAGAPAPPDPDKDKKNETQKQPSPLDKRQRTKEQIEADATRKTIEKAANETGQKFEKAAQTAAKQVAQETEAATAGYVGPQKLKVPGKAPLAAEAPTEAEVTAAAKAPRAAITDITKVPDTLEEYVPPCKGSDLGMTNTVKKHIMDMSKKREWSRPYMHGGTSFLVDEIMSSSKPAKDLFLKKGLKWVTPGCCNGSSGVWELVVDIEEMKIVHLFFDSKPRL